MDHSSKESSDQGGREPHRLPVDGDKDLNTIQDGLPDKKKDGVTSTASRVLQRKDPPPPQDSDSSGVTGSKGAVMERKDFRKQLEKPFKQLLEVLPPAMIDGQLLGLVPTILGQDGLDSSAAERDCDGDDDADPQDLARITTGQGHSQEWRLTENDSENSIGSKEAEVLKRARLYILSLEKDAEQLAKTNRELEERLDGLKK